MIRAKTWKIMINRTLSTGIRKAFLSFSTIRNLDYAPKTFLNIFPSDKEFNLLAIVACFRHIIDGMNIKRFVHP